MRNTRCLRMLMYKSSIRYMAVLNNTANQKYGWACTLAKHIVQHACAASIISVACGVVWCGWCCLFVSISLATRTINTFMYVSELQVLMALA